MTRNTLDDTFRTARETLNRIASKSIFAAVNFIDHAKQKKNFDEVVSLIRTEPELEIYSNLAYSDNGEFVLLVQLRRDGPHTSFIFTDLEMIIKLLECLLVEKRDFQFSSTREELLERFLQVKSEPVVWGKKPQRQKRKRKRVVKEKRQPLLVPNLTVMALVEFAIYDKRRPLTFNQIYGHIRANLISPFERCEVISRGYLEDMIDELVEKGDILVTPTRKYFLPDSRKESIKAIFLRSGISTLKLGLWKLKHFDASKSHFAR